MGPRLAARPGRSQRCGATLRGFDKDTRRAMIRNFNLATLAVTFAGYLATGVVTREMPAMGTNRCSISVAMAAYNMHGSGRHSPR